MATATPGTFFQAELGDSGGAYGSHGWTEVHLGAGGWVPLDATLGEIEVLESGHIRLGEQAVFQPVRVEVVSFELAP